MTNQLSVLDLGDDLPVVYISFQRPAAQLIASGYLSLVKLPLAVPSTTFRDFLGERCAIVAGVTYDAAAAEQHDWLLTDSERNAQTCPQGIIGLATIEIAWPELRLSATEVLAVEGTANSFNQHWGRLTDLDRHHVCLALREKTNNEA